MGNKIALIGAGSGYFEKVLIEICMTPELAGSSIMLYDVGEERMEIIRQVGERLIAHHQADLTLDSTTDVARALDGADYTVSSIGVHGPSASWHLLDVDVCARFGILHTTGDTVGPAGLSQGLRLIPIYLDIARQMKKYCPNAILLNHSNPMSPICRAVTKATGINVIGYCHNVAGTKGYFARMLDVPAEEIEIKATGPNHMLWTLGVTHKGRDIYPELKKRILQDEDSSDRPFSKEILKRFDLYPIGGDRHIIEFYPELRKVTQAEDLPYGLQWRRHMIEQGRLQKEIINEPTDLEKRARGEAPLITMDKPSPESMGQQIRAIARDEQMVHYVNTTNHNAVPNLPEWAVLELEAAIGSEGARPLYVGELPPQAARWSLATLYSHELMVDAAIESSREKALQALATDPMMIDFNEVEPLFDALVEAHEDRLAQFRK